MLVDSLHGIPSDMEREVRCAHSHPPILVFDLLSLPIDLPVGRHCELSAILMAVLTHSVFLL